jgi:ribonuclease HII
LTHPRRFVAQKGPVVAVACHVPLELDIPGLQDSKAIGEEDRERIYEQLVSTPGVLWAVEAVDHTTIDEINILQASMLAMQRALQARLEHHTPEERGRVYALVDGNRAPDLGDVQGECVIKGDSKIRCIAAASIIAKVRLSRGEEDDSKEGFLLGIFLSC